MSVQESYLKAIADAIRHKEGSQDAIFAKDFSKRIMALECGGERPPPAAGGMEVLEGWQQDRELYVGPVRMPGIQWVEMDGGMEILEE